MRSLHPAPGASAALPATAPGTSAAPNWADVIGAQLSGPVSRMQSVLTDIRNRRGFTGVHLQTLECELAAAARIAMQSQQLARLANGRLRQSHERLALHAVVRDVLEGRQATAQAAGIQLRHQLKPVEVIVDPGLLVSLIEALVEWAGEQGTRVTARLDVKNWPEHAVLMVKAGRDVHVQGEDDRREPDTLAWHLLLQTGLAMGVMIDRTMAPDHVLVSVEFPRTVKQLEGLTAVEVELDSGNSSVFQSESKPLAGYRLLLITADPKLHAEVDLICDQLGLVLDCTPTTRQATRFCELDAPHMILVDERLRDDEFEHLRSDLLRNDVNFPFLEIADEANTFEISAWMGDSMSRVSRGDVRAQLPSALVMELAKIV